MDANALDSTDEQIAINVAASFTADLLEVPLRFWMEELRMQARIEFAPYGQLFKQLLSYNNSSSNTNNEFNVHLVRVEDWGGASANNVVGSFESEIERNVGDFLHYVRSALERSP